MFAEHSAQRSAQCIGFDISTAHYPCPADSLKQHPLYLAGYAFLIADDRSGNRLVGQVHTCLPCRVMAVDHFPCPSRCDSWHRRYSTLEYIRFLDIAHGSAAELETQLYLSRALSYVDEQGADLLIQRLFEVERMLTGLKRSLRTRQSRPRPSAD